MSFPSRPDLKTLEEFCAFYEKDSVENKQWLFNQYCFAMKERDRLREKDKRSRQRKKEEKALLPPVPRKKPGPKGPWKHKRLNPEGLENLPVPLETTDYPPK